jgi:hypothetical protein
MNQEDLPDTATPLMAGVAPSATGAMPRKWPAQDGTAADTEDLQEIMATGERLPEGMSDSDILSEEDAMLADDFEGRTASDQEEE